ncbi:hypothetical protein JCM6882_007519 [Rhodosporidiobolus microsporus]
MASPLPNLSSSSSLASLQALSHHAHSTHPSAGPHPGRIVDYVLLAEFDIDQGSVLKHQYPALTGCDEHLLAEHMLPDGAHDRPEDWTVFYLNQVPGLTTDPGLLADALAGAAEGGQAKGKGRAGEGEGEGAGAGGDGKAHKEGDRELLYVMSLVRTKKDATVRRGALVKALAVATRHPYIQIFKPILLLALDSYFSSPSPSVLSSLYSALNAMDISALPFLTLDERVVLRTSERKDLFEDKFVAAAEEAGVRRSGSVVSRTERGGGARRDANDTDTDSAAEVLLPSSASSSALNLTQPQNRDGFTRSPSLSSLASATPSASGTTANGSVEDLTSTTASSTYSGSRSRAGTISSLGGDDRAGWSPSYPSSSAGGALPPPVPPVSRPAAAPAAAQVQAQVQKPKDTHWFETKVVYNGMSIPVRIPLGTFPREIGEYSLITLTQLLSAPTSHSFPPPYHPHLHTLSPASSTPPLILLFNALLTGQRVVFLGHQQPASRVAEMVLAACALVSGCGSVMGGVERRAFPYTNLANLDNLQNVPGFIAGVCNPAFLDRPSWWDVLCNLETGKIIVSKDLKAPPPPSSFPAGSRNTIGRAADLASAWAAGGGGGAGQGEGAGQGAGGVDEFGAAMPPPATSSAKEQGGGGGGGGKGEAPDSVFMDEILHAIHAHYGEPVIRARLTDYATRFVRLAARYEEEIASPSSSSRAPSIGWRSVPFSDGSRGGYGAQPSLGSGLVGAEERGPGGAGREVAASAARVEGWMRTESYRLCQQSFRQSLLDSPLRAFDLTHQIARLRQSRQMSAAEARLIFQTLAEQVRGDEAVVALLAQLPSHFGGLLPLAFGFFHPSSEVRHHTLELFDTLSAHPTGRKFVSALNAFHRTAYARLRSERDAALAADHAHAAAHEQQRAGREREATATPGNVGGVGVGGPVVPAKDW